MTKGTDTKNLKIIVRSLLKKYNVLDDKGDIDLQAEIDFTNAFMRYMFEREEGRTPAEIRQRIVNEYGELGFIGVSEQARERARMMQLIMDAIGVDVDESNADWAAVISHCIEAEKRGETVAKFREWMNSDPYNSPKKHQIAQSPLLIKKTWRSAFEKKTDEEQGIYTPRINA